LLNSRSNTLLWEYASANRPMQETRRSSGVANRVYSAYAYCKPGLKKYMPERYRTSEAAITGRYTNSCLSKAQIGCDNHQHDCCQSVICYRTSGLSTIQAKYYTRSTTLCRFWWRRSFVAANSKKIRFIPLKEGSGVHINMIQPHTPAAGQSFSN
jgi:hypothetical protein